MGWFEAAAPGCGLVAVRSGISGAGSSIYLAGSTKAAPAALVGGGGLVLGRDTGGAAAADRTPRLHDGVTNGAGGAKATWRPWRRTGGSDAWYDVGECFRRTAHRRVHGLRGVGGLMLQVL